MLNNIIPLSKWNEHYKYPSVLALRKYRFQNTKNFNEKVVRLMGKRIYIDADALTEWSKEDAKKCLK